MYIHAHVAASSDALLAFAAIFDVVRELVNNGVECGLWKSCGCGEEREVPLDLSKRSDEKRKDGEI